MLRIVDDIAHRYVVHVDTARCDDNLVSGKSVRLRCIIDRYAFHLGLFAIAAHQDLIVDRQYSGLYTSGNTKAGTTAFEHIANGQTKRFVDSALRLPKTIDGL